jgi:two-component system cell cycle sensor histidine kinase PleC
MSNAIKFSHPGSSVHVEAVIDTDGCYLITVGDKGIGIAAEHLPLVLEPFGQVENPQNRRIGGTGLGLPIAKALVELHGGDIDIRSTVGDGTAVSLRFPPQRILANPSQTSSVVTEFPLRRAAQ